MLFSRVSKQCLAHRCGQQLLNLSFSELLHCHCFPSFCLRLCGSVGAKGAPCRHGGSLPSAYCR